MRRSLAIGAFIIFSAFSLTFVSMSQAVQEPQATAAQAVNAVKTENVCMVNDTVMNKTQIPVKVEGKTYYGCCEGCVAKLKKSKTLRYAVDPVTGNQVDKAKAFIAEGKNGAALYFESRETAEKYLASQNN